MSPARFSPTHLHAAAFLCFHFKIYLIEKQDLYDNMYLMCVSLDYHLIDCTMESPTAASASPSPQGTVCRLSIATT